MSLEVATLNRIMHSTVVNLDWLKKRACNTLIFCGLHIVVR
jgi:hypothetical protein